MANKLTQQAGLTFNINSVKTNMKSYFETQGADQPMFSGSQTAMTTLIQRMCEMLLKECLKYASKDKTGMKNVTRPTMKTAVCVNSDLIEYYYQKMLKFDEKNMYADQLPVDKKEFETVCTNVDKSLKLTPRATNFLMYLVHTVYLDVLSTSYQFMKCSGKKTLNATYVLYAVKNRLCNNVSHDMCVEIEKVMKLVGDEDTDKVSNDEDKDTNKKQDTGAEDTGDEVEAPAEDSKKDKEDKKKDKKKKDAKDDKKSASAKDKLVDDDDDGVVEDEKDKKDEKKDAKEKDDKKDKKKNTDKKGNQQKSTRTTKA